MLAAVGGGFFIWRALAACSKKHQKMSDHIIPFDIQRDIMQKLPVKSLIRFCSVSKQWKCLIDSSNFINDHTRINHNEFQHRLLVQLDLDNDSDVEYEYISMIDDETFPNQRSSVTVPPPLSLLEGVILLDCLNGLLCFYGSYPGLGVSTTDMAVLWNPIIRKSVGIVIPNAKFNNVVIGFGVRRDTNDPKLVEIMYGDTPSVRWEVNVFTLSTRVWKSVSNIAPAFDSCYLTWGQVCINGFIYLQARDRTNKDNVIISVDLKREEFGQVCLPDRLLGPFHWEVKEVNESLGVLEGSYDYEGKVSVCDVWMMDFATKSFTKMFTIKVPGELPYYGALGFRKNGEVIMEVEDGSDGKSKFEVYEPSSGCMNGIGITGIYGSSRVKSYMETLLLLDETKSIIH